MNYRELFDSLWSTLGTTLPSIAGAIAILVVGWIAAVVVRGVLNRALAALRVDERVASMSGSKLEVQRWTGMIAYFVVLGIALIAFFNTLDLGQVSQPLQSMIERVLGYLPNLVAGGVLALLAWLLALLLRNIVQKGLARTSLDEKVSRAADVRPLSDTLSLGAYGLTLLLFTPAVLAALKLGGLLAPLEQMVGEILGIFPNVASGAVLAVAGWIVARLVRDLVTNLLAATGLDAFGRNAGIRGTMTLSKLTGFIVFVFVLVPALIAALDALKLETISRPASEMLGTMMGVLPELFAAGLIVGLAILVAGLIGTIVSDLLGGVGFDRLPEKLGFSAPASGAKTPSQVAGRLAQVFVILLAVVEAANVLGFGQLAELAGSLTELAGRVLLGSIVMVAGLWLGRVMHGAVVRVDEPHSGALATLVRVAVSGLAVAMGLRTMGIADEIVTMAFTLVVGAIAVAIALSFGLGGREAAARQLENWTQWLGARRDGDAQ